MASARAPAGEPLKSEQDKRARQYGGEDEQRQHLLAHQALAFEALAPAGGSLFLHRGSDDGPAAATMAPGTTLDAGLTRATRR